MIKIGEINPEHFKEITPVLTKDVVMTEKQIQHIKERHPNDYEQYSGYIPQILSEPDYILEANKPYSAVLLKEIASDNGCFRLILRLKASIDPGEYENSVISFWKTDKKRYENYVKNKNILYKAERL